jgi:hypothetical protein
MTRKHARSFPLRANGLMAWFVASVCLSANIARSDEWAEQDGRSVALIRDDAVVWQFNYGPDEPKPYFHPVALPGGPVLTWNRPPDHVWHHGLWFSWKYINGLNYWEPKSPGGLPEGATEWSDVRVKTSPDGSAQIELDLAYGPRGGEILLTEKRTITVSAPDEAGEYHFDWTCKFSAGDQDVLLDRTPLPDEPGGKAWGGYAGLSVRLAKDLSDRAAVTTEGPVLSGDQQRFRGKATAMEYQGRIGGRTVGVAICDHPGNLNHPTPWYAIRSRPMSYFSPAVICYEPYTLPAGENFTLQYRVIVHPGHWDAARLTAAFRQFSGR